MLVGVPLAALLAGCASPVPAPVDDRRPAPLAAPKPPAAEATPVPGAPSGTYVVKRGDTLYSIALEHGVDYRELAQWNRLDDPGKIRAGQQLRLDAPEEPKAVAQVGTARSRSAVEARPLSEAPPPLQVAPVDGGTKTSPKALRLPYSEQNLALLSRSDQAPAAKPAPQPAVQPVSTAVVRPEAAAPRDPEAIEFIWPAKGRVLTGFAEPNSKGVDIAGRSGDPVLAAAPGRVMYTGSGIRGYGKLIVIKHDNGFNSVYAHNREILVKEGQSVARGQQIAELGDTDTDTPKLHFEIRKSGKPVDPLRYLPPS
jgi:lipoprotein NlpD